MQWYGWVAIAGACAWLPQLFIIIYHFFVKPKLRFSPGPTTEVGYTHYGPILNPSFGISTSRKDTLIEKIELEVIHELGAKREFIWQFFSEAPSEMEISTGEIQLYRKTQPVTALKVTSTTLIGTKIGFQDNAFIEKKTSIFNKLIKKDEHIKKKRPQEYPDALFKEIEWTDIENFLKNEFYWKAGKYQVFLKAYHTPSRKPHIECYTFSLSQTYIDRLERNIEITINYFKSIILFDAKIIPSLPKPTWNWINPLIQIQEIKSHKTNPNKRSQKGTQSGKAVDFLED